MHGVRVHEAVPFVRETIVIYAIWHSPPLETMFILTLRPQPIRFTEINDSNLLLKEGRNGFPRHFQQLISYRDEIETQNTE